jgi:hypothetical protein
VGLDVRLAGSAQVEIQPPVAQPPLLLPHELAAALWCEIHLPQPQMKRSNGVIIRQEPRLVWTNVVVGGDVNRAGYS